MPHPREISRPVLRYHGGKFILAPWIISFFPPHRIYCEPFGGGASVLLRKPRSYAEIYNDLDSEIVNVFRVLRFKPSAEILERELFLTPYSRIEFEKALEKTSDPVELARRTIIRSFMSYSSDGPTRDCRSGFRVTNFSSGRYAARDWENYPQHIESFIERLRGVVIECDGAFRVIERYDSPETLFYVDPPYVKSKIYHKTREVYRHGLTDDDHRRLGEKLNAIAGSAIVSGFRCELYDELFKGWKRVDKEVTGQAGRSRGSKMNIESLWISPAALKKRKTPLGF